MGNADGIKEGYERVTTILYPFSGLQAVPPEILQAAARRGTRVHKICESIMYGFGEHDIDDEVAGYVNSFKIWWKQGHNIKGIEARYYCDEEKITGQLDILEVQFDGLAIIDIKTSARPSKTWEVQGSGYAYLLQQNGLEAKRIGILQVMRDGRAPIMHEYDPNPDLFLSTLKVYRHFYGRRNGKV